MRRSTGPLLLLLAACASAPVAPAPLADLPPLPRSSIVAVLAHRGELGLDDAQVAALDRADAELQVQLSRLRAEGMPPAEPRPAAGPPPGMGPPSSGPGAAGPGGGRAPGMGMSSGPGGFQLSPSGGGMGGGMGGGAGHGGAGHGGAGHGGAAGAAPAGPPRRDAARAREALKARLDDADTRAFLKVEPVLTPAQQARARELASRYREQLFERREQQRGR